MMPGFRAAEHQWENMLPPDMEQDCTDDCGECQECLAEDAEAEVEALADEKRKDRRYNR